MEDFFIQPNALLDKYCFSICKAKCCYSKWGACPNLSEDHKCKIHSKWNDNWCNYKTEEFFTAPIMVAIKKRLLPESVMQQCCYAHPELLEKLNGN